jgi:hypothetical protein
VYFGNKTVGIHILRGILGFASIYGALATVGATILPSLVLVPAALYFLKGCPMCWTVGLIETISSVIRKPGQSVQMQDGTCCTVERKLRPRT